MANTENKVKFLGRDVDPDLVVVGGFFLMMAGIWAGNSPSLAVPAIIVGLGMMVHGTNKMGQQNRQT